MLRWHSDKKLYATLNSSLPSGPELLALATMTVMIFVCGLRQSASKWQRVSPALEGLLLLGL